MRDSGIKYESPIVFHIPAIFDKKYLYPEQNSFYHLLNSVKKDNVSFSAYGCPMSCTWNGGRLIFEPTYPIEEFDRMLSFYKEWNIQVQITFTNYFITETDLYDRLGNALLRSINKNCDFVEVMVSGDILENFIRTKYPNIKITRSALNETNPTNEEFAKYSHVVLPKWRNHDEGFINTISQEYRKKIEVICSEPCAVDCPRKKQHYEEYCNTQMYEYENPEKYGNLYCDQNIDGESPNELMVLPEEINEYVKKYQITHFKLQGREDTYHMITDIAKYCVREEDKSRFLINASLKLKDRIRI